MPIAIFAAFVAYKGFQIADKSEKMPQWYEDNNEAVLFGRYLRVNGTYIGDSGMTNGLKTLA